MCYTILQILSIIAIVAHITYGGTDDAENPDCPADHTECGAVGGISRRCCPNQTEDCCESPYFFKSNQCCTKSETCCPKVGATQVTCCDADEVCHSSTKSHPYWQCNPKYCVYKDKILGTYCAMQGTPQCRNMEEQYDKTDAYVSENEGIPCLMWNITSRYWYEGNKCMSTTDWDGPWCYVGPTYKPDAYEYCYLACPEAERFKE